jgi:FAD/FMN-containing dehydrogenase
MTTTTSAEIPAAIRGLAERFGERIHLEADLREHFKSDFGRLVTRIPGAVARCHNAQEVAEVIRYAREHKIPVVARGQGHTQSGQACTDGGILIDSSSMQTIHEIDTVGLTATVDGGTIWRDLVAASVPLGFVPPTLTNNLGVSVAGTTSVAGLGVASYRYGAQADNAVELEVVTGAGDIVTCSREVNRELFDVVRCGLGQFAFITKVKTRLRPCKQKVRMYHLLYTDLGAFLRDSEKIMHPSDTRFHTLESRSAAMPIFTRRIGEGLTLGEGMQMYAFWAYPMFLTVEYSEGENPDDAALLQGLEHFKHLRTEEYTQLEFCNRLVPVFEFWHRSGNWEMAHPWMEVIMPWDKTQEFIELIQSQLPPQALGVGGHVLVWPAHTGASDAPLFMRPPGDYVMGWGILPAVPHKFLDQALAQLDLASELSMAYGGKRYLSGYITFKTKEQWAAHFGDKWGMVCAAKKKFDPDHILGPGFIQYE